MMYLDGIMGVVVGDALGVPVEFVARKELQKNPVTGMTGDGTFPLPIGSWSDDSSMTLATLDSLSQDIDICDMMSRFVHWLTKGEYTPFGEPFGVGRGTHTAIRHFMNQGSVTTCGCNTEMDNGNGSLMRIMPVCLYCCDLVKKGEISTDVAITYIEQVSALTHSHVRSKLACGIYFFIVSVMLTYDTPLLHRVKTGVTIAKNYYTQKKYDANEVAQFERVFRVEELMQMPEEEIRSTGYVVDTLEAAIWSLLTTSSYEECELKAVNLGEDTDTVAAIAGGLAGLYYGYEAIPKEWIKVIQKREWIEGLCKKMEEKEC